MEISIHNNEGTPYKSFTVDDDIEFIGGRISKGKKGYYKGVGVPYKLQHIHELTDEYKYVGKTGIFYLGPRVSKICFQGKFGVQEKSEAESYSIHSQTSFSLLYCATKGASETPERESILLFITSVLLLHSFKKLPSVCNASKSLSLRSIFDLFNSLAMALYTGIIGIL